MHILSGRFSRFPALTVNLGLRYDLDTPRTERFDRMNYFDPYVASPLAAKVPGFPESARAGLVFIGVNGMSRHQYNWDTNNLAPRIGFAFKAKDKTVIRGGWGNFYGVRRSRHQHRGTVRVPHRNITG